MSFGFGCLIHDILAHFIHSFCITLFLFLNPWFSFLLIPYDYILWESYVVHGLVVFFLVYCQQSCKIPIQTVLVLFFLTLFGYLRDGV